ncbi:hypothetical protein [Sorangium sp. So ce1099]|uniref:hypothetical protein n=1 Tax=Sorangium sp. So ce1099 TaxID=3133331 RepID=UPI003F617DD5
MTPDHPARLERWLCHPHFFRGVLLLTAVLAAPSIAVGFYADDYHFFAFLSKKYPGSPPWYDLYRFLTGDARTTRALIEMSGVPWWTDPEIRIHLVRPLASALLALQRALFGDASLPYHLVSIALYLALVAAAGKLFQRALPGAAGALALLIFAISAAHANPVGWISCQHLLLGALSVVLGLLASLRYREEGWRPGRYLGPLGLGVGLLSGEVALGGAGFWVAYQLAGPAPRGSAGGWRARLVSALPVLGLLAYFAVYKAVGGGAARTAAYIEPLSDPLRFAAAAAERLPLLLGHALATIPSELSTALPSGPFIVAALAAVAGAALLYRACLPSIPEAERVALRWLVPGAVLALLVTAGGFPGSRLLLLPNVGFAPLLAVLVVHGLRRGPARGVASHARRAGAGLLGFVHVALAPLLFLLGIRMSADIARSVEEIARTAEIDAPPRKRVFIAASSDPMASTYPAAILVTTSPEALSCWSILSMTKATHRLTRTGASSLALAPVERPMLTGMFETLYRSPEAPLRVGDAIRQCDATIRVAAVEGGRPTRIEVELGTPLEDPELVLLTWRDGRLRRVAPPAVGEVLELPWSIGPTGFF